MAASLRRAASSASRILYSATSGIISRPAVQNLKYAESELGFKGLVSDVRFFSSLPAYTEMTMPSLSPTMTQGNLGAWQIKEGQEVAPGDVLADIETDKATLAWENQEEGFIAKILVPAGSRDIPVGKALAILVEDAADVDKFKDYTPSAVAEPEKEDSKIPEAAVAETWEAVSDSKPHEVNHRVGPAARKLLIENGLSIRDIFPTGPHNIVTKGDVLAAAAGGKKAAPKAAPAANPKAEEARPAAKAQPPPAAAAVAAPSAAVARGGAAGKGPKFTDVPNSQIRKIIASRLLQSKTTIPHMYVSAQAELGAINEMRQDLKNQGTKVSVNDFVIRAVALALAEVPQANALWDAAAEAPATASGVDIAIAVATDAGLITPIVKAADTKTLLAISAEVRALATRARANKLKPEEFQGGSFSISNLGMFGVDEFSAIINPPQACIMAVGGTQQRIVLVKGEPVAEPVMTVTLSADNRVYDAELAAQFLEAFCRNMANPVKLLM